MLVDYFFVRQMKSNTRASLGINHLRHVRRNLHFSFSVKLSDFLGVEQIFDTKESVNVPASSPGKFAIGLFKIMFVMLRIYLR